MSKESEKVFFKKCRVYSVPYFVTVTVVGDESKAGLR